MESKKVFSKGEIVCLASNKMIKGAIIDFTKVGEEFCYKVFIEGKINNLFGSQLISESNNDSSTVLSKIELDNLLTSIQIQNPSNSTLYSLNSARIDFIPYQFRPVLKFIHSDRPRLLIADGVGVGKTIEAGLILKELQARSTIKNILIICPRPLVTERKWENEMKRFDEKFIHLDGNSLRYCINEMDLDGEWPEQYSRCIVPFSLFDEILLRGTVYGERRKHKVGLLDLDPPPRFDLVIVDEAHHIKNSSSLRHEAVSFFCDHAEAVLFLTATPIQLGNQDLFVLLNTLRPDLVIDKQSFAHMTAPNPYINKAVKHIREKEIDWIENSLSELNDASNTSWGKNMLVHNPEFNNVLSILRQQNINEDVRVKLINQVESFHTLSGVISRTRRRDIGNFTIRKPESIYIPFTAEQKELHDTVLALQEEILTSKYCTNNIKFMLTTIRRQTASCIFGLKPFLKSILTKHVDDLEIFEEIEFDDQQTIVLDISEISNKIQNLIEFANKIDSTDPKFEAVLKIILDKQKLSNKRIMLFSTFRHTLSYLYDRFKEHKINVGLIHGGVDDDTRRDLRRRFEIEPDQVDSIDVLLFSEVGCEGLDYQFCDCMINYDLPWNPMKIEQRIGRIDRNGQKSESVVIYNLITPETIDADIYDRCMLRIGVFSESIGDCEEILGEITNEIQSISSSYKLNSIEIKNKLQQLADNQIRLLQEQEQLERKQLDLFGINFPQINIQQEIDAASSFWLTPNALYELITRYLKLINDNVDVSISGSDKIKSIRVSEKIRKKLLIDFFHLPNIKNSVNQNWEKFLRSDNSYLKIIIDYNFANGIENTFLLTPLHPIAIQAANYFKTSDKRRIRLNCKTNIIDPGIYSFGIYHWTYSGIKSFSELIPVSSNQLLAKNLFKLLESSQECRDDLINEIESEKIKEIHFYTWKSAKEKYVSEAKNIINFKLESLKSSHLARVALINEQLKLAKNEKIIKMRKAQIFNADSDFDYRKTQLKNSEDSIDILGDCIVLGCINII